LLAWRDDWISGLTSDDVFGARDVVAAGKGGMGGGGGLRPAKPSSVEDTDKCRGGGCREVGFRGGSGGSFGGTSGVGPPSVFERPVTNGLRLKGRGSTDETEEDTDLR
jgi:hypothetical protein